MLKRLLLILTLAAALVACQNTPASTSTPQLTSPDVSSPSLDASPSEDMEASPSEDTEASPSGDDDESPEPSES